MHAHQYLILTQIRNLNFVLRPFFSLLLILFVLSQIVLMSLLAALVASRPQDQGQDCGDPIECLKQNIPGKIAFFHERFLTKFIYQVNLGRTIPSIMLASCANSIPRTQAAQAGANKALWSLH